MTLSKTLHTILCLYTEPHCAECRYVSHVFIVMLNVVVLTFVAWNWLHQDNLIAFPEPSRPSTSLDFESLPWTWGISYQEPRGASDQLQGHHHRFHIYHQQLPIGTKKKKKFFKWHLHERFVCQNAHKTAFKIAHETTPRHSAQWHSAKWHSA